jgi:hypothetical protein
VVVSRSGAPVRADVSPPRGVPDVLRDRAGSAFRCSARRAFLWLARSRWLHTPRAVWLEERHRETRHRTTSSLMPRAEVASPGCSLAALSPALAGARAFSRDIRAIAARRLFKATACACSRRLPSKGSPALHRGSTRAIPCYRSRAFAPHPCRSGSKPAPPRHGLVHARLRYLALAAAGAALMSEKDTPNRLLQTYHSTRTLRIG